MVEYQSANHRPSSHCFLQSSLSYPHGPASHVKQGGQLLQFRCSPWWDPHRTWAFYIDRVALSGRQECTRREKKIFFNNNKKRMYAEGRGRKRSGIRYKCGRRPVLLSNPSQQKILTIRRKEILWWLEIHQKNINGHRTLFLHLWDWKLKQRQTINIGWVPPIHQAEC